MKRILSILAALLGAGCCTRYALKPEHLVNLEYAEGGGRVVEHYQIQNYGWYLFNSIPLVCGDTDHDAIICFSLFRDRVRTDLLTDELNRHARKVGAVPRCVATLNTDHVSIQIPGTTFPLVFPYIICYREVQISALLVKETAK